jgi:hypothetical protein
MRKTTRYFEQMRLREDRKDIEMAWIERVISDPERRITQADGRFRLWGRIDEANGKYLRVILLEDGETLHNAFFDRGFDP